MCDLTVFSAERVAVQAAGSLVLPEVKLSKLNSVC